jgi:hypothetical protein
MEGCLWLQNLNGRRFKTFPKRKDPALFFKAEGPFRSFFSFLLTLLLIGGQPCSFGMMNYLRKLLHTLECNALALLYR